MNFVMKYLDIGDMTISIVYFSLVVLDFKAAEIFYDRVLNEFFMMNERNLHKGFKYIHKVMETTVYNWIRAAKDIFMALLSAIIPMLPQFIRTPLDFIGITTYLEKSLDKYNAFEEKNIKEKQYMEYAKKIE
jgi:hypothetical protein